MFQQTFSKQNGQYIKQVEVSDLQKDSVLTKIYDSDIYQEFLKQWGNADNQSQSTHKPGSQDRDRV